jgi:hypothetical protein
VEKLSEKPHDRVEQITEIATNSHYRCPEPIPVIVGGALRAKDEVHYFDFPKAYGGMQLG